MKFNDGNNNHNYNVTPDYNNRVELFGGGTANTKNLHDMVFNGGGSFNNSGPASKSRRE